MADITMCNQTLCPNAGSCKRIQAMASDWQSYATFRYTVSVRGVECENYLPMYRVTASDSTVPNENEITGVRPMRTETPTLNEVDMRQIQHSVSTSQLIEPSGSVPNEVKYGSKNPA